MKPNENNDPHLRSQIEHLQQRVADLEALLSEREDKFRTLTDSAPVGIFLNDAQGRTIYINKKCAELVGVPADGGLDFDWIHFLHPDDRELMVSEWEKAFRNSTEFHLEYRWVHQDGKIVWTFGEVIPILGEEGKATMFIGSLTDITARKEAEIEKERLQNQLIQAQKIESIGQLAGGIAHDFNNLLSVIVNNLELLQFKQLSGTPFDENIARVRQASLSAKDLVAQILTFSRQEKLALVPVDLTTIVGDAMKFLRPMIPTTVEVMTVVSAEPLPIHADTTQLQQVLINLCNNAVHAMNEKGLLHINLDEEELSGREVSRTSESQPGRYAKLSVTDTGKGMDKEILKRIFEPFFTTKALGVGTGMGLSMIHGIVEQHGGIILVDSTPGQGSTFTLYFPVTSVDEVTDKTVVEKALPTGTERILLVDDEPCVAESCGALLEDPLGYKVTVMTDSVEALDLFKAHPYHFELVITDQTMPVMSGVELAKELLSIRPELPVILCSGYSAKVNEDVAKEIGISAFCMKPLAMQQLALVVREVLDSSGQSAIKD